MTGRGFGIEKIGFLKLFGTLGARVQAFVVRGATCKIAGSLGG